MNRRNFLGCTIGSALALSGLFKINHASALPISAYLKPNPLNSMTNGEIATINHLSSLDRIRKIYLHDPTQLSNSEIVINGEFINSQFFGDYDALDRLVYLSSILLETNPQSPESFIQAAKISSSRHEFSQALGYLEIANSLHANPTEYQPLILNIEQALGLNETEILAARTKLVQINGSPENLIPYAALLAEMGLTDKADSHYQLALVRHKDTSPFIPAYICFQLGMLWGEGSQHPNYEKASKWYKTAISLLPSYTKARIHLAETHIATGNVDYALQTLLPALSSTDPEVSWRLSELYALKKEPDLSLEYLNFSKSMFNTLLSKHQLAFADHASEFFLSSGGDRKRALDLALINYENRPTKRANKLLEEVKKSTS